MLASELITKLQKAIDKWGDLPVGVEGSKIGEGSIFRIHPINIEGYSVELYAERGPAVEIFLEGF